jgi:lysozyme family protein
VLFEHLKSENAMIDNFPDAFTRLIGNEGGYAVDCGGPTMWGVTEAVARDWGYMGDMCDLQKDTAFMIARVKYWNRYRCDDLDPHLAFQVLDAAYNGGYPVHWLQQASGATVDGAFGAKTLAAILGTDSQKMILRFDAYRLIYLSDLNEWPTYGRGWAHRIAHNLLDAAA